MTIYYVDPRNGSNTNSGLSWALAWKWPPGNGAAISPGDEIRIAKSPERTGTTSYQIFSDSVSVSGLHNGGYLGYNPISAGLSGVSVPADGSANVVIAAGTVIPANTKIAYSTYNCPASYTSGVGPTLDATVTMRGVPTSASGQNLRIAICSDSLGNTPIFYLDGPTVLSDDAATTLDTAAYVVFSYISGATLSITVNSVALYSGSTSFTAPSQGSRVNFYSMYRNSPDPSNVNFQRHGSFMRFASPPLPVRPTVSAALPLLDGATPRAVVSGSFNPIIRTTPRYISFGKSTTFQHYDGMTPANQVYSTFEANLTFSGSAALPINISGGWNTATNTQDGYTNLGLDQLPFAARKGSFVFSAGGQYVRFSRFIAVHCPLVYYDYAVGTLQEVRVSDSNYGNRDLAFGYGVALLGVSTANTTLTINTVLIERCVTHGLVTVQRGRSNYNLTTPSNAYFANGNLTLGQVDFVDCTIGSPALLTAYYKYTTHFKIRSSVPGSYSSVIATVYTYSASLTMEAGVGSTFRIADTIICPNTLQFVASTGENASNFAVELNNVYFSEYVTQNYVEHGVYFNYAKSVNVNGLWLYNGASNSYGGYAGVLLRLIYSTAWHTNNPAGIALTLAGTIEVYGGGWYDALEIDCPPANFDWSAYTYTSTRYPIVSLLNTAVNGEYRGIRAPYIYVTHAADTQYYPNQAMVKLFSCTGRVRSSEYGVLGRIRAYDGTVPPDSQTEYSLSMDRYTVSTGGSWTGVALYNYTVPGELYNAFTGSNSSSGTQYQHRRSIGVDLTASSPVRLTATSGNYDDISKNTYHFKSATFSGATTVNAIANGSDLYGWLGGGLMRKAGGEFSFKAGASAAYTTSTQLNSYGKYPFRMIGTFVLGAFDVIASTSITFTVRFQGESLLGHLLMVVPPSEAYSTDLHGHATRKNVVTTEQDTLHSFTISPTKDGVVYVALYASHPVTVKDFTVTVQ